MAPAILGPITKTPSYQAARWFLGDCVLRFRRRLILITGLGLGSAALQGASLILLNAAIAGSNGTAPVNIPLPGLDPNHVIPVAVPLIVTALMLSALLAYSQGRQVLRLWQAYQVHSVNRIYDAVRSAAARGLDPKVIDGSPTLKVLRLSQRLGALTRVVGSSTAPGLRFIVFSVVAVMLNPMLTIMLALVTVPSAGLALMYFARRASHSARRVVALSGAAGRELDRLLKQALQGDEKAVMPEVGAKSSPFTEKILALTGRILYVEQAKFTAGLIAMASLGFFVGREFLGPSDDAVAWGSVLVYALALLLAFQQLVTVASSISSFGRFYPAMQAQHQLVEALEKASSSQDFLDRLKRTSIGKTVALDDDILEEDQ